MNILLTSVGRRSYIVDYFKQALKGNGEVHVSNSTPLSPAFSSADKFIVSPLIYSDEYISFLQSYAKENDITHIISLFDADLPVLSHNKELFQSNGVYIMVSDEKIIETCNDKWKAYQFLHEKGFETPQTYISLAEAKASIDQGILSFPLILKPRWGMGSIGLFEANSPIELNFFYDYIRKLIQQTYLQYENDQDLEHCVLIQEKIVGIEYGLDIINDLKGAYCTTIPKRKLAMRSGETDIAEVGSDLSLEALGKKLADCLKHIAILDTDVIRKGDKNFIIDLNNRFGGGYPFSHNAGINLPLAMINWFENPTSNQTSLLQIKNPGIYMKDITIVKEKRQGS